MNWNVTHLDNVTITWVSSGPAHPNQAHVQGILDPSSSAPARRLFRDGSVATIDGEGAGLTVFGSHVWDRPSPAQAGKMCPEYAELLNRFARSRGVTHHRVTGSGDPLLLVHEVAARIGVAPRTISRYRHRGDMPTPDEVVRGRSRWHASTIDQWQDSRPGRGRRSTRATLPR